MITLFKIAPQSQSFPLQVSPSDTILYICLFMILQSSEKTLEGLFTARSPMFQMVSKKRFSIFVNGGDKI